MAKKGKGLLITPTRSLDVPKFCDLLRIPATEILIGAYNRAMPAINLPRNKKLFSMDCLIQHVEQLKKKAAQFVLILTLQLNPNTKYQCMHTCGLLESIVYLCQLLNS